MNSLIRAAQVFSFNIPEWLEDDVVIGKVAGVSIHVGEVRRLSKALESISLATDMHDQEILKWLRKDRRIEAIKYRREVTTEGLKEAKDYVDQLGIKHGLLREEAGNWGNRIVSVVR